MTLRAKASIVLCLIISVALGATGYFYLNFLESSLRHSILDGLTSVTDTSSQTISRFMADSLREARAIAYALPVEDVERQAPPRIEKILEDYLKIFPKFENGMFILDAEGKLWADYPAHPEVRGRVLSYREYFKRTMREGRGIIGQPYRSVRTGEPVLTFTAVLKGADGSIVGMLGCSVQLTSEKALGGLRLTRIGKTGYIYVYNKNRVMMLHPKKERVLAKDVPVGANALFDAAIDGYEGTGETVNSRGIPMLISLKHIPGTDWIVASQQPKGEALLPIREARSRIMLTILLATVASGALGALLMKGITNPLKRLRDASRLMEDIDKQDRDAQGGSAFSTRLDTIPDSGELGALKHALLTLHGKLGQTMKTLQDMAADWKNTFDSVEEAIFLLDREKRILRLNRAAGRIIGKPEDAVIGTPIREALAGHADQFAAALEVMGGASLERELTADIRMDGGVIRTYEISSTPLIDENGNDVGTVVAGKDISARLRAEAEKARLERQLTKSKQMEAIGMLAGGVAHDLNNILSGIISYPELLLMRLPEDSDMRRPLETVMNSGLKASAIVQDLLTLARRGVASVEVVSVNAVIDEYLKSPEFEKLMYHHPSVTVVTDFEDDLLNIEGSRVHLSKTFMNLVSNAAEAMPHGGRILLSTHNRHIDRDAPGPVRIGHGDYVAVSILDEGMGIEKEAIDHIFEPFYTKKVMGRSGTGLGMSVVWGTVKDHKGHIDVRSEVGAWTEITLLFPATRKNIPAATVLCDLSDLKGCGESVLVVDDVDAQREIAGSILAELGYTVDTVASGETAVAYMAHHRVDLLVLDMIMSPGMDGYETYRQAVRINPGQKAIIASGYSENSRVKMTQALGAGECVKKPYTIRNIGLAVKRELSR